jgi:hypothetical protein
MGQPQSGILPDSSCHAAFLTFTLCAGNEITEQVRQAAANLPGLTCSLIS